MYKDFVTDLNLRDLVWQYWFCKDFEIYARRCIWCVRCINKCCCDELRFTTSFLIAWNFTFEYYVWGRTWNLKPYNLFRESCKKVKYSIIILNLIRISENRTRESIFRETFAYAIEFINTNLSLEESLEISSPESK